MYGRKHVRLRDVTRQRWVYDEYRHGMRVVARARAVPPASRVRVEVRGSFRFYLATVEKDNLAEVGDEANRSLGRSQKAEM